MGWLEDLILGADAFLPDYGKTGMDLSPEERRKLIEERMRGYTPLIPRISEAASLSQKDLEMQSAEQAGIQSPGSDARQQIADAQRRAEVERAESESKAEETKRMQEEAYQRQLDPYSWLGGKGGEDPAAKLEKLRRIREQAGSAGGGGTFSQQANSPELQQRLAERDAWAADQPMRDMEFLASAEQARRNPQLAMSAAESLARMKEQKTVEQRQKMQELFVSRLAGAGGTIPQEQAAQLQALGVNVPYGAIGSSADDAVAFFDDAISKAGTFLAQLDPIDATSGHPMIQVQKYGAMLAEKYKQLVAEGKMNPDDARREWQSEMARVAMQAGVINAQEQASMMQQ